MLATETSIEDVLVVDPEVYEDERGWFAETWNARAFEQATGFPAAFCQDNHSHSRRHVLRGLHYQVRHPQGKLIRVAAGEVRAVAADIRPWSPTFRSWHATELSGANHRQLWLGQGLAFGFLVLSDAADLLYKVTDYRYPQHERSIAWDDPELAIDWLLPSGTEPVLSARDAAAPPLAEADLPAFDGHVA